MEANECEAIWQQMCQGDIPEEPRFYSQTNCQGPFHTVDPAMHGMVLEATPFQSLILPADIAAEFLLSSYDEWLVFPYQFEQRTEEDANVLFVDFRGTTMKVYHPLNEAKALRLFWRKAPPQRTKAKRPPPSGIPKRTEQILAKRPWEDDALFQTVPEPAQNDATQFLTTVIAIALLCVALTAGCVWWSVRQRKPTAFQTSNDFESTGRQTYSTFLV